jgi:hypothetical protein
MNVRSRGSIAVFPISRSAGFLFCAASMAPADSGEGGGDGLLDGTGGSGPSVIVAGAGSDSGGDGSDAGGEPVVPADPAEDPQND